MKRRLISAALVPFMLCIGLMQSGCFGSFALTQKAHGFVSGIGSDDMVGKFVRTIIMYAGFIVPAWEIMMFVDIVILNLIEFWTGSNPIAMQEGEMEQQVITYAGDDYLVTATKNQFQFEKLAAGVAVQESFLQFCNEDMSWSYIKDGESQILTAFRGVDENNIATVDVYTVEGVKTFKTQAQAFGSI